MEAQDTSTEKGFIGLCEVTIRPEGAGVWSFSITKLGFQVLGCRAYILTS